MERSLPLPHPIVCFFSSPIFPSYLFPLPISPSYFFPSYLLFLLLPAALLVLLCVVAVTVAVVALGHGAPVHGLEEQWVLLVLLLDARAQLLGELLGKVVLDKELRAQEHRAGGALTRIQLQGLLDNTRTLEVSECTWTQQGLLDNTWTLEVSECTWTQQGLLDNTRSLEVYFYH